MKTFNISIKRYERVPQGWIFGEHSKEVQKTFGRKPGVYFFVKLPASFWHPKTFKVRSNFILDGYASIGGKKRKVKIDMAAVWFEIKLLRQSFASKEEMVAYVMRRSSQNPWLIKTDDRKYRLGTEINVAQSGSEWLIVDCELGRNINEERIPTAELSIYSLINLFDWQAPHSEVRYIGKNETRMMKRVSKHEKWGPVTALKERNDDIAIYFMEVEASSADVRPDGSLKEFRDSNVTDTEAILIAEVALIKLFDPLHNTGSTKGEVRDSERVQVLHRNKYDAISVHFELVGGLSTMGTPKAGFLAAHSACYNLR
ncbi:hypothetical protein ACC696_12940 [Rhizobium ruizarguesonis]|jgi:hypothetical protein|uniref:hypothetical protein n=1 Tax=Rhizobium ruizarguesonis TaxID=2081791 RepID=UPI0013B9664A|nr:hypothetical protein [Rhizobium ruizarguesonis]MBY5855661.1 hypothetical protein [Rhizobium leguminosarum]NEH66767.1 hypothetical protein [Rhizobium ruizarguesonis]NEI31027.1 hypothetical protein [Rhizobium ruizarguesonis]